MERKLYKTKLCALYRRGRCSRLTCSFAHGEAELRRLPGSMNGRRDYRGGDLRDRLDNRHSPYRRYSPGRDVRGRPAFYGQKQAPRDRGYSLSRSPVRSSERKHTRKQHYEGESDYSRSLKLSDDDEDQPKERKVHSDDETDGIKEKLKDVQLLIGNLDESKHQLEMDLREKSLEADKLSAHIQELETQLSQEREDCRRLVSKNKKFVKALGRYMRAQEELKRSQARLLKLSDQFGSDALKSGANEEDSSINVLSDVELNNIGGRQDTPSHASPVRKRGRISMDIDGEPKPGSSKVKDRFIETVSDRPIAQPDHGWRETGISNASLVKFEVRKVVGDDQSQKTRKNGISRTALDKAKVYERGSHLPSTSIAAHAIDELIDAVDVDERSGAAESNALSQNGVSGVNAALPRLPLLPPKITSGAYNKYEDDDEEVDVVDIDAEAEDADTNEV